jgi:SAM-dependent methyltransferase
MNSCCFPAPGYIGIDINPRYVSYARRRFNRNFIIADACNYAPIDRRKFDLILANSLLHHLDDAQCIELMRNAALLLADGGHVHFLDLVLPNRLGVPYWLARHDRGEHARPLEDWREMFQKFFQPVLFEPFSIYAGGLELLQMVYFKGRRAL